MKSSMAFAHMDARTCRRDHQLQTLRSTPAVVKPGLKALQHKCLEHQVIAEREQAPLWIHRGQLIIEQVY